MESAKDDFMWESGMKIECRKVTNTSMYRNRMGQVSVVMTFLWGWQDYRKVPSYKYTKKSYTQCLANPSQATSFVHAINLYLSVTFYLGCYKSFIPK